MEAYEEVNKVLDTDYSSNEEVDWCSISACDLSIDLVRKIKDYIDWKDYTYIHRKEIDEDFIREFKDYVDWLVLSRVKKFTPEFIEEFNDKIVFSDYLMRNTLPEDLLRKFKDSGKIHIIPICRTQPVSTKFLESYINEIPWSIVCKYRKLGLRFIEKHKDKVSWLNISIFQKLSEPFIEKHWKDVSLINIVKSQKLSTGFIIRHIDEVSISDLMINPKLEEETLVLLHSQFRKLPWLFYSNSKGCFNYVMNPNG